MILNHKSFSLIELIFSIIIIGIIATVAIPKLLNTTDQTTILKAKNDLNIILNGLKTYKNSLTLQNLTNSLDSLEDNENYLFSNILKQPFIASTNTVASWSKRSNSIYQYWIDNSSNVEFIYDKTELTFMCDKTDDICKEILK